MQQSEEMQGEEKQNLGEVVNASLGMGGGGEQSSESEHDELPEGAKKRLGMQEKRHKKEMRRMQQQLDEVRQHLGSRPEPMNSPENGMNPYSSQPESGSMDDTVYKAVARAMELQKMQEQKSKEAEKMQHVYKAHEDFKDTLEKASDKYEDFDDVVMSKDAPYTDAMHNAALMIHNPEDTLYHLGKDKEKLKRISELHPLDQMKEVIKLSQALAIGEHGKQSNSSHAKPLGQVKNNPVTSNTVNEATSVGELRKRMREGGKKWG